MSVEDRIAELDLRLPTARTPIGSYVRAVRVGDMLFVSGTGSRTEEHGYYGKVGRDLSVDNGYQAARICALVVLSTLRESLQSLDNVERIVAMTGFVAATEEFTEHPKVLNGASDLFLQVFGEKGRHARSAVGVNSLPLGLAVEIEVLVQCVPM